MCVESTSACMYTYEHIYMHRDAYMHECVRECAGIRPRGLRYFTPSHSGTPWILRDSSD